MGNWTQGPWEADQCGVSANGEDVCDCGERAQWSGDSFHPFKNAEANARLIAAAPELYEALERLQRCANECFGWDKSELSDEGVALSCAIAALAKARGET